MAAIRKAGTGSGQMLAVLALAAGCSGSDAGSQPVRDGGLDPRADGAVSDAMMTYAVCLADSSPAFVNIRTNLFAVSCTSGSICHSTAQSMSNGGGGLDLQTDSYVHLLGANGLGAPANNYEGAARGLLRVKPGDPDNSLLVKKLTIMTNGDPDYGSGMPYPAPGSVCPATLALIRSWIAQGAPND